MLAFVRPATRMDIEDFAQDKEQIETQAARPDTIALVAISEGRIAGLCLYRFNETRLRIAQCWYESREVIGAFLGFLQCRLSQRRKRLIWDVPERDLSLQLMLKEMGGRCVKVVRKGFDETPLYRFLWVDSAPF